MFKYIKILSVLSLSFLLFIIGCGDDNPVEPEETHFEAIGLYIISGGDTLVTYEAGVVSGEITVNQGDTTALLSVKFITEDGDIGIPPNDAWSFDWEVTDISSAGVVGHDEEFALYQFHVEGKKSGSTAIRIIINHNNHKDFESKEIPIEIF